MLFLNGKVGPPATSEAGARRTAIKCKYSDMSTKL
jgi:hypothetical protein